MHILFVHRCSPAQFEAFSRRWMAEGRGQVTFCGEAASAPVAGSRFVQYATRGASNDHTHFLSRGFENAVWHAEAVYSALAANPDIRPDVVVGHSGFGSTMLLPQLYDAPIVNYFEIFFATNGGTASFRTDTKEPAFARVSHVMNNAVHLMDLATAKLGYSPTRWQRETMPKEFQPKVREIFDGMETDIWARRPVPRRIAGKAIPEGMKVVTYVSRGFEAMRGFDIFMKVAKRICDARKDVMFVVVGSDRVSYGGDLMYTGGINFREWVLSQDDYDMSRFLFLGAIPRDQLIDVYSLSDLHIYLTVPFVPSWSMFNAMSCACTMLVSDVAPLEDIITDGVNGLKAPFFDVDGLVKKAMQVLDDPQGHRALAAAARRTIEERYSLDVCYPKFVQLIEDATGRKTEARTPIAPKEEPRRPLPLIPAKPGKPEAALIM